MANFVWPPGLPQRPIQSGYGENGGVLIARTPTAKGPGKSRYCGVKPDVLQTAWRMSADQVAVFEAFVKTTLLGVRRFNLAHPRTEAAVEVKLVPSGEGDLYELMPLGGRTWEVRFTIEVLP